jgi:hypothetical protein
MPLALDKETRILKPLPAGWTLGPRRAGGIPAIVEL